MIDDELISPDELQHITCTNILDIIAYKEREFVLQNKVPTLLKLDRLSYIMLKDALGYDPLSNRAIRRYHEMEVVYTDNEEGTVEIL